MRVIALSTIKAFLNRSADVADAREPLMAWFRQVRRADWAKPADVKRDVRSASILKDGRAVGSIQEVNLARLLHDGTDPARVRVEDIMARPLPQVAIGVHLDEAYRLLLAGNSGVLATSGGAVVDIVTRIDLITYWNRPRH